jgi:hypothetical protein
MVNTKICWKIEEEGIRLQNFTFFGGWVWREGKKKRQARANCVRPSRAPTSHKKFMNQWPSREITRMDKWSFGHFEPTAKS